MMATRKEVKKRMNRLKNLRKEAGLSLRKCAEKCGISNAIISYLETGTRPFRQEHISKLTAFFNVTSDFLLGRTDYGYIVNPEFGDGEITLTEGEYQRLRDYIVVSIVRLGSKARTVQIDTPKESQSVTVPEYVVYRELKGSIEDYDAQEMLSSKLMELSKHMTSAELDRTIRFIEEYILKK